MKRLIIICAVLLLCSGCGMPTQQDFQEWTTALDAVIPAVREVAGDNPKLDKIIDDVEVVRESVADAKTPAEAVSKGIEASKPFNPYADEMNAVLGLAVVLGGLFGKKKLDAVTNKYTAMKVGVEKFRNDNDGAKDLYADIGNARKAKGIT